MNEKSKLLSISSWQGGDVAYNIQFITEAKRQTYEAHKKLFF